MKADARAFLLAVLEAHAWKPYGGAEDHPRGPIPPTADEIGEKLGMAPKRIQYLLVDKWSRWWEYGVSARTGWFTPEGLELLKAQGFAPTPRVEWTPGDGERFPGDG